MSGKNNGLEQSDIKQVAQSNMDIIGAMKKLSLALQHSKNSKTVVPNHEQPLDSAEPTEIPNRLIL